MPQDHRFQMRATAEFLAHLDRLKGKYGVRDRPEVVRIAVAKLVESEGFGIGEANSKPKPDTE